MKITILFLLLCIGFSCIKEEEKKSGYNCVNFQCTATFDNPTYLTLQDCQSECKANSTNPTTPTTKSGVAHFYVAFNQVVNSVVCYSRYTVGVGFSSTDVSNDTFFDSASYDSSHNLYINIANPGVYYYKATKKGTTTSCPTVSKTGSFTIKSGATTYIYIVL